MVEIRASPFAWRADSAIPAFDDSKPLFVFDGICVLCSGGAAWFMRHDRHARVNFVSAQSQLGQSLYAHFGIEIDESYLLIHRGKVYTASRGYLELCVILGGWWHLLRVAGVLPERWRDAA